MIYKTNRRWVSALASVFTCFVIVQLVFGIPDPPPPVDTDHDGLTDLQEYQLGTNPNNPDTDYDGLTDLQEYQLGTNPLNPDTDGDGLSDGDEIAYGLNPLSPNAAIPVGPLSPNICPS